jgi:predicted metalloprotease
MNFGSDDDADGGQVEDRRGQSFGGPMVLGGGGLGLVGVVAYVIIRLLGGNVAIDPNGGGNLAPPSQSQPVATNESLGGSCQGVTSTTDPAKFISCVVSSVQHFWQKRFARDNQPYRSAHLVLFSDATASGCGTASAATGPFYCPRDGKVYLDLGFFQELSQRFHARGGDFAEAYVVAHEYGHHVQDLMGIERRMRQAEQANPGERNELSVKLELQADCFAGVWGHAVYDKGTVTRAEISQALDAAAAVGDDRIQKEMQGRVNPESFTHGSAQERMRWFETGMQSGDVAQCDTFGR